MAMDLSNDNLNPFESEREIPGNAPGFPGFGAVPDIETRISIDIRISNLDTRITLNIEHWLARNNGEQEHYFISLYYYSLIRSNCEYVLAFLRSSEVVFLNKIQIQICTDRNANFEYICAMQQRLCVQALFVLLCASMAVSHQHRMQSNSVMCIFFF